MTRRLLGLAGYARSGKTTAGSMTGWVQRAFAAPIQKALLEIDPVVGEFTLALNAFGHEFSLGEFPGGKVLLRLSQVVAKYGWEKAKQIPEVRRLLQVAGASLRSSDREWVIKRSDFSPAGPGVVFTDVREPEEIAAIRRHGGFVAWVARGGPLNDHPNENAIGPTDCDYYLDNRECSLAELPGRVAKMMAELFGDPVQRAVLAADAEVRRLQESCRVTPEMLNTPIGGKHA